MTTATVNGAGPPAAVLELAGLDQWVDWKEVVREGKPTKPPYQPSGDLAKSTDPATWVSYETAQQALGSGRWAGIGFVFSPDDPYAGVDLDGCRDVETGRIAEWAQVIIDSVNSYTEVSPSGTGVKVFARGKLPTEGHKKTLTDVERITDKKSPAVEMYDCGRFFTVTGQHLEGTPRTIEDRANELAGLHARLFGKAAAPTSDGQRATSRVSVDDLELLRIAFNAKNGAEIEALWNGNTSRYGDDDSAADCALVAHLAFYTDDDRARLDRLFRQSGLYREKWEREDYRQRTFNKALSGMTRTYSPAGPRLVLSNNGTGRRDGAAAGVEQPVVPQARGEPSWPKPLAPEAFHGWAGALVKAIEPYSEADPAALLAHVLCGAGALIGPNVYARAGDALHPARLNAAIVGETSKGRKGSAARPTERVLRLGDPDFGARITEGLSSGEGLIWQVRDPVEKYERQGHGEDRKVELVEVDPGIGDKRLLVIESEFASTLRVLQREGNTLSTVVRRAWDSGDLKTLTKNSPAVATGAHICVVGHVTKDELLRYLDRSEMGNGFANRFLWIAAKRGQVLPDGEGTPNDVLQPFVDELSQTARWAKTVRVMPRDAEAGEVWRELYPKLSAGAAGMFGGATNRAEAQVLRLSVLYAALDRSESIGANHLLAALAVWKYAEDSARWIFGDAVGDPTADAILSALRQNGELTRNDLVDLFGRHVNRSRIDLALGLLLRLGLAGMRKEDTGGRPREVWFAK